MCNDNGGLRALTLALFTLALFAATPLAAAIPAAERAALVALYQSTGGDGWTDRSGWLGAPGSECSWYGISCNDEGTAVVSISMGSNDLTGPLPSEIGDLPSLRSLYLGENALSGSIPAAIGKLASLEELSLHRNQLTGSIPPAIGGLTALRMLSLFDNQLSGALPGEIGNLPALVELFLFTNLLEGPLPSSLGNLDALTILDLAENRIDGPLPAALGQMASLQEIRLGGNLLSGHLPEELGTLPTLRVLSLNENQIEGPLPVSIGGLAALEALEIVGNRLTGSIPQGIGNLAALQRLELGYNAIEGTLPASLVTLPELTVLSLPGNQIEGTLPADWSGVPRLAVLNLAVNQFTGPVPAGLSVLQQLEVLELGSNSLTGAMPASLGELAALRYLDLSGNGLTGPIPPELGNLFQLETIILYFNGLTGPIPTSLGRLPQLTTLILNANRLTGTIPDLSAAASLADLQLYGNLLTGPIPSWIGQMGNLEVLVLADNRLDGPIPPSLTGLERLFYLDLGTNRLTGTIPADLGNLRNLAYLTLSDNLLSGALPESFWSMTQLVDARLANLGLTGSIAPAIGAFTSLLNLDLSNNRLSGTIPPQIGDAAALQYLSMDGNHLEGAIPPEFGELSSLLQFNLARNRLKGEVPVELMQLSSLESRGIDLGFNMLRVSDAALRTFIEEHSQQDEWESTQTVTPGGLRIVSSTDRSVTAEWTPIPYFFDEGGYRLVATPASGGSPVIVTTGSKEQSSAVVRGLAPSTGYGITISAVTHPHDYQPNLLVSDPSAAVTATTGPAVSSPPDVVVTAAPKGLVQIGGDAVNQDSAQLTNYGDAGTVVAFAQEGTFFSIEPASFPLAAGETRSVTITTVAQQPGAYWGHIEVTGTGVPEGTLIPVTLLSVARPAGTVVAEAVQTRIEVTGLAGTDSIGNVAFRNVGNAPLSGILVSDEPWIVPATNPIQIDPGLSASANFTIVRARRPLGAQSGAISGTLKLVYVDGSSGEGAGGVQAMNGGGVSVTLVTVVDVARPPVTPGSVPPLAPGEVALFVPGVSTLQAEGRKIASDVTIANAFGTRPLEDVRLYLTTAGTSAQAALPAIASSSSLTLSNLLPTVFSTTAGTSSLQIRTSEWRNAGALAQRLSFTSGASTVGDIPVFRSDRSAGPGEATYLAGLRGGSFSSTVLLQETIGAPAMASIDYLDGEGSVVGTASGTLAPFGMLELPAAPATASAAVITSSAASSGRLAAWARVEDGVSGDSWGVVDWSRAAAFDRGQPVRVPVVSFAEGAPPVRRRPVRGPSSGAAMHAGGTTTEIELFNPGGEEAFVVIERLGSSSGQSSLAVPPRSTRRVSEGGAFNGSVIVRPAPGHTVAVSARAWGAADGGGTAGSRLPVVPLSTGLRLGQAQQFPAVEDSTAATADARRPGTFSTGFALVETSGAAVRVRATLQLPSGRVTATVGKDFTVPAGGIVRHTRLLSALLGPTRETLYGDLHDLRVEFRVMEGAGSVVPLLVVVDNGSGDPLVRSE